MQIRVRICVRCTNVSPPPETPEREGAATRECRSSSSKPRDHSGSRSGRATRIHAQAGSRCPRDRPVNFRPRRAAARRDDRDAVGHPFDPRRRTRAPARGAPPRTSCESDSSRTARETQSGPDRCRRPNPSREGGRLEPRRDRTPAHGRRGSNCARRRSVVAVNRACSSPPISCMRVAAGRVSVRTTSARSRHRDDDQESGDVTPAGATRVLADRLERAG